ncbi:hypothetical protein QTP86_024130, partial [Hemibagrus guttatus]
INAEFLHITTLPLQPRYLASLNGQSSQFLHIIKSKGGAVREKTKDTIKVMADQREEAEREFEKTTMVVFVIHEGDALSRPLDIAIVIDGVEVLKELSSVASACSMMFGLIYALNLKYPEALKYRPSKKISLRPSKKNHGYRE